MKEKTANSSRSKVEFRLCVGSTTEKRKTGAATDHPGAARKWRPHASWRRLPPRRDPLELMHPRIGGDQGGWQTQRRQPGWERWRATSACPEGISEGGARCQRWEFISPKNHSSCFMTAWIGSWTTTFSWHSRGRIQAALTWCTKNPLPERYTNILWWFNDFFFKRFLLKKPQKFV